MPLAAVALAITAAISGHQAQELRALGTAPIRHRRDLTRRRPMLTAVASWYFDAGSTACGFHAGMGVANKTLDCGTRILFSYHGRDAVATVDDRGPYIAGRTVDLNQTTAGALGFAGVDMVAY